MFLRRRLSPPLFTRRLCERPRVSLSASRGPSPPHQLAFAAAALACLGGVWTLYRAARLAQPPPTPPPAARGISQTHPLLLAGSGLDDEQKLQVALCRRQLWLRAAQFGPALAAAAYAAVALLQRAGMRLPRGSRAAAPLCGGLVGMSAGASYGGAETKERMNAALRLRPIAGVHLHGAARTESVAAARRGAAESEQPTPPREREGQEVRAEWN